MWGVGDLCCPPIQRECEWRKVSKLDGCIEVILEKLLYCCCRGGSNIEKDVRG